MYKSLAVLGTLLLLSTGVARAQSPSPETMAAARKLVITLRLPINTGRCCRESCSVSNRR